MGGDGMRVCVVGERGYIGSNLVQYLQRKEYRISDDWDVDCIVNCAQHGAKPGQDDLEKMVWSNILLPIECVKKAKLIHISSSSEIFQPDTLYSRTKSLATDYLRGKATLVYIYTAFGGASQHEHMFMTQLLKAKKEGKMFQVETPYATRDFVHIKRICEGIEKLLHEPIQEVHFGHGKARRMFSVAKRVMDYKYEWSGGQGEQPEWKAANPHLTDTFEEDLQEELCEL
jgi:nucleoside-diphosphate-sugar epimerase